MAKKKKSTESESAGIRHEIPLMDPTLAVAAANAILKEHQEPIAIIHAERIGATSFGFAIKTVTGTGKKFTIDDSSITLPFVHTKEHWGVVMPDNKCMWIGVK